MIKKCCFLLIILVFSLFANSQKMGESVIYSLLIIAENNITQNPYKGIIYANKAFIISKDLNKSDFIAKSLILISENQLKLLDIENTEKNLISASKFANTKLTKSKLFRGLGFLNLNKSNSAKALEFFLKALTISEELGDQNEIATNCFSIGNYYKVEKNKEQALAYLNRSLSINKKLKLKSKIVNDLSHIGEIYSKNQDYSIAENTFKKAKLLNKSSNNNSNLMYINFYMADMYNRQNKFIDALKCITISSKIALELNNINILMGSKFTESNIYTKIVKNQPLSKEKNNLIEKAIKLIDEVSIVNEKTKNYINLGLCYKTQSQLYTLQNKHEKATQAMQDYAICKDYIFNEQSKETVQNLEDQRTIDLKNKEILINKITLESKEKQKWFYIFGIGFLSIFGFSLFYQNQNRKKTNQKLQVLNQDLDQANKTKIKFLSILNHDLRSPVYNFIHFMQLQKESPELLDTQTKNEIQEKTILSAENLLISMEDILLWSKGQMENFEPQPKLIAINEIFDYAKKHFESEEKVKIVFENPDNLEIYTDENFLKTIIRNFTGNAIKALKGTINPSVTWKAYRVNNEIYLSISDNGSGSDQEKFKALYDENEVIGIKTGLGLHLIRDIAKAINCEITVNSKIGLGTTFVLKFDID